MCFALTCVAQNAERLDSEIRYDRDFDYDYFGFKTLERSYLLRIDGKVVERPQHMLMRVAVGIHKVRTAGSTLCMCLTDTVQGSPLVGALACYSGQVHTEAALVLQLRTS